MIDPYTEELENLVKTIMTYYATYASLNSSEGTASDLLYVAIYKENKNRIVDEQEAYRLLTEMHPTLLSRVAEECRLRELDEIL